MSYLTQEIASQPECWAKAIEMAASSEAEAALPRPGERVAAIGCGSSLNVARGYATLREAAGQGETDAFPASEAPLTRRYDRLVFISRTGTTTEVLDALRNAPRDVTTVAVTADPGAPLAREADQVVWLDFATERSVVSSRFITSSLVLLRAHLGEDVGELPGQAARELARPLPPGLAGRTEFTFLGHGWAAAVADEAALKLREASRPRGAGDRGGRRGGTEAARGPAHLGRVLPGAGIPARPDQRQRPEHRGLGPRRGPRRPAGGRRAHRRHRDRGRR
jgi:fructoselysine-6-P-deglycase FrlB-like protein